MTLLLLRHGATRATEERLYCGSTDLPLSEAGQKALSQRKAPAMERHYTSGMRRADETMELLYPGQAYTRVPALREMDFGEFEMKSYEMLRDTPAYQAWITGDNEKNRCPGGESGAAALTRAMAALEEIVRAGQDCAVVTHGGVVAGAMDCWFPGTGRSRYQWQSQPGAGYIVSFLGDRPEAFRVFPTGGIER